MSPDQSFLEIMSDPGDLKQLRSDDELMSDEEVQVRPKSRLNNSMFTDANGTEDSMYKSMDRFYRLERVKSDTQIDAQREASLT